MVMSILYRRFDVMSNEMREIIWTFRFEEYHKNTLIDAAEDPVPQSLYYSERFNIDPTTVQFNSYLRDKDGTLYEVA